MLNTNSSSSTSRYLQQIKNVNPVVVGFGCAGKKRVTVFSDFSGSSSTGLPTTTPTPTTHTNTTYHHHHIPPSPPRYGQVPRRPRPPLFRFFSLFPFAPSHLPSTACRFHTKPVRATPQVVTPGTQETQSRSGWGVRVGSVERYERRAGREGETESCAREENAHTSALAGAENGGTL